MHYIELVDEENGLRSLFPANELSFYEEGNSQTNILRYRSDLGSFIPWSYDAVLEAITQSKGFVSFPIRDKE